MKFTKLFFIFTLAPLLGIIMALTLSFDEVTYTDCRPLAVETSNSGHYLDNLLKTFKELKTAKGSLQDSLKRKINYIKNSRSYCESYPEKVRNSGFALKQ